MALDEYNFDTYNAEQLKHIERHLDGSDTAGSHFNNGSFDSARSLVDYATKLFQDYEGEVLVIEVDTGRTIGFDAVITLKGLPPGATINQEPRGKDGYLANIVEGVPKVPTSYLTAIAGPMGDDLHGFYTIHPGRSAPPFPVSGFGLCDSEPDDDVLEKKLIENKENGQFWENHGFIKD